MARVPRRRSEWVRRVILLTVVVVGTFLASEWLPWKSLPPLDYTKVLSLDAPVLSAWLPAAAVIAALVSAAVAAVRRDS
jgi:hypothetical protein